MSTGSKIINPRRRRLKQQTQTFLDALHRDSPTLSRRWNSEPHTVTASSWSVTSLYESSDVTKPLNIPDIVEKGDHVPLSCPLWQRDYWIEPPRHDGRCPRCRRLNYTTAIYSQSVKHRGTRKRRRRLYRAP